jgi:putative copper resistance protein D
VRIAGPAALVLVGYLAAALALPFTGATDPGLISDAGAIVRWGLPLAKLLVDLSAAVAIGALVLAAFAMSSDREEYGATLDVAAAASAVWTVSSALTGFFSFLYATEQSITFDDRFGEYLGTWISGTEGGQQLLATTLIAAALTVLCFAVRGQTLVAVLAIGGILGLIPLALGGHAGGTDQHDAATSAIYVHIAGAAVWIGGLSVLAIVGFRFGVGRIAQILPRYSSIALICFVAVAISGYVSAAIRVGTVEALATPYGVLVLVKVGALLALGLFGLVQRRFLIARMTGPQVGERRWLGILVAGELAFMGIASGVAAALARSAPPVDQVPVTEVEGATPAQVLTGAPLPDALTTVGLFAHWSFDTVWVVVCIFLLFFYLAGVVRLKRRGDAWPVHRTILWVLGVAVLFYITNGGLYVYGKYLFSAHMSAHMVLTMLIPVLLVPAAPITLALRAIRKRTDGSRGGREWILLLVHSRYFGVLVNPVVAAVLFAGSLWVFYYTPLFRWATVDHVGHEWMTIHFLLTGYLFVSAIAGVDPAPRKAPYPLRLIILLGTMAFHAFFGLALIGGTTLLLPDWYGAMGWGTDALADQQTGGGIAWGVGEIPTVVLAVVVAAQWYFSDRRESARYDRKAARDGDAELAAYNEMLAQRASRTLR